MKENGLRVKLALLEKARQKLHLQIKEVKDQLSELVAAGTQEGKSSAGDKYETQREMIRQSRDMLDVQLSRIQLMLGQLNKTPSQVMEMVQEGALMRLSTGYFWVSVSLGKLEHEGIDYQLISKDAPLFLAVSGLKAGESTLFRGRNLKVEVVI